MSTMPSSSGANRTKILPSMNLESGALDRPTLAELLDISCLENSFRRVDLDSGQFSNIVDTEADVEGLIEKLRDLPTNPPSLYIDLEGVNLSRHGSISILQIFVLPLEKTYLIDIHILKKKAFLHSGCNNGQTLLDILESPHIPKVFFDVRNDSDALFSHFGVKLAGVVDLQLMELATRDFSKKYVKGLAKCIEKDLPITNQEIQSWKAAKEKGLNLFDPKRGGSYDIFNVRPLSSDIIKYCVQDVHFLPKLWLHYRRKITPMWNKRVVTEAMNRVMVSQTATYEAKGRGKALAPAGWW